MQFKLSNMKHLYFILSILVLQLHTLVYSQVPTDGCDAISNGTTCFNYYTHGGINWMGSSQQCQNIGYDLATVSSAEEKALIVSIRTNPSNSWIGLYSPSSDNTFVWIDGSDSTYRDWNPGEPSGGTDCVEMYGTGDYFWNDLGCSQNLNSYICSSNVDVFGEVIASIYSALSDNTILTSNTTLYCVTENMNTPEVMWSYVDPSGIRTDLNSTTDPTTGVSTIQVYTTQPGSYSCEVTEDGGVVRTYTAVIFDSNPNPVPSSGCGAISNEGTCFRYFESSLINWGDSRQQCLSSGYNLATISSSEENTLLLSIVTGSGNCWIGLNDMANEGTFVWVDGSDSTYRNFDNGQPDLGSLENCVEFRPNGRWNDAQCLLQIFTCYFCSIKVNVFGEVTGSTYSALSDNTILTTDTTLYCITENMNTPEVMWSYVDLFGIRTDLTSTTDPNTGVSTIQAYITQPGSYSCEVTESGGMNRTYTAVIPDTDPNTVPTSGCDAISSDGTCINYFTGSLNWEDSRLQCVSSGYDLVTISSSEQNNLLFSINTGSIECWIGLRETDINGRFTWADGTVNNFRRFDTGQPNGGPPEQCVHTTNILDTWNDTPCTDILPCYFCGTKLDVFGEVIASTYSALSDNTILTTNTTLYCITENMNTPEVMWSYVDLSGISTDLTSTTDPNTGISTIPAYTTQPVYYSCEVTESGGTSRTYTVGLFSPNFYTEAVANRYYTYTIGIDNEDIYLFYSPADNSVQLTDIHWMIQGLPGILANPLNIYSLASYIGDMNVITLNCYDIESGNILVSVALFVQNQPLIQLGNQIITSFPLLPPDVNRADFTILSEDVVLSTNLQGRWQRPNSNNDTLSYITFDIFQQSDEGLYRFYVTNWEGIETLAIQIYITAVESTQSIINLRTDSSGESSVLVFWELSESNASYTDVIFSIYLGLADYEFLVGTTLFHHYEITNLQGNVNYTIRVEFQIPFSTENVSATTYHFREPIATPTNNITQSTKSNVIIPTTNPVIYVIVVGVVIIIILLLLILVIAVVVCFFMKRNSLKKSVKSQTNPQLFDLPARGNETYNQDVNVNLAYSPEKKVDLSIEKPPLEVSSPNDYST
ncbi:Low affinity immunoglobulin epsilon Fc receptor-like [Oopsacas minuta]|uniref:Low affinity immunoglobulin epsilon Fc receptor-like n=1 Tax=Oopsacas minuta TaxID=111878 RepID=A0AAV7JF60_9METZ|nr:Low affinity immunoglobulin epsilon Fc receptor-like [Oopsacas minuta]